MAFREVPEGKRLTSLSPMETERLGTRWRCTPIVLRGKLLDKRCGSVDGSRCRAPP